MGDKGEVQGKPGVLDAQENASFMFALAALLLKKLGGKLTVSRKELEEMMVNSNTYLIDGHVEGDNVQLEYKACGLERGRIVVNTGAVN